MAYSFVEYTGDGSETDFSFPFDYIKGADITVTVDDVVVTAWTFPSAGAIRFTVAPAADAAILIARHTELDEREVSWTDGALTVATDQNIDSKQPFYLIQELEDEIDGLRDSLAELGTGGLEFVEGPGIEIDQDVDAGTVTIGLFTAMTGSMSGGSNNEIGSSVASVNLTWSFSKTLTAQELVGTGTVPPILAAVAQTVTGPFTTNQTFTITGHTASETVDASTSVSFFSKRYWGVSSLTSLTDAQIIALAGSELSSSRTQTRSLSPSAQYIYFAWPTSFGTPSFTVNGLANTAWTKVRSASAFVNASGTSVSYDLWRSDNLLTSTYSVGVA